MTPQALVDRTSCSICMEQYCSNKHVPKLLPCQHTFCLDCLTSMSTSEGVISCLVCRKQYTTPPRNFLTNRIVLDIVEEMQKVPQLNKNVIWWMSLCWKLLQYAQIVRKWCVIWGAKLLLCAVVCAYMFLFIFGPFWETIEKHITREGCYAVTGLSFLLSCCQLVVAPIPKHETLPTWCMDNMKYALKALLVNFMLVPGMCSVFIFAVDTHMQHIKGIGFRDWFNVIVLSVCCRAVSYQVLSFKALKDDLIVKVSKYICKAFIIHSMFTVFFVTVGFLDVSSITKGFEIQDLFISPNTRKLFGHYINDEYYCVPAYRYQNPNFPVPSCDSFQHVKLFSYTYGPCNIPCLKVTSGGMILFSALIQASCVIQSISLICVYHTNLNL